MIVPYEGSIDYLQTNEIKRVKLNATYLSSYSMPEQIAQIMLSNNDEAF